MSDCDMVPLLLDQRDPAARGEAHGEVWREHIRELADMRVRLCLVRGNFRNEREVLDVAGLHLPALASREPPLFDELCGIARGSNTTREAIVVLNHYTDLRDVPRSILDDPTHVDIQGEITPDGDADPGGCTALYANGPEGAILGQTWDMHGSAARFVRMLRIQPKNGDQELVMFTLTGCLGMAGMNEHGVAIAINNLSSTDAHVGTVWTAVVRRMLEEPSAERACNVLFGAILSSGHNYMIADGNAFYGVETSGTSKVLTQTGVHTAHLHTNHCLDPTLRKLERISSTSTTFRRLELGTALYAQTKPATLAQVWAFLSSHEGFPGSICSHVGEHSDDPSASCTCGIVAMRMRDGLVRATSGCGHASRPIDVCVERRSID